jgi:hypothetical protein
MKKVYNLYKDVYIENIELQRTRSNEKDKKDINRHRIPNKCCVKLIYIIYIHVYYQ